jgi:uncharacterized protein YndB with AHSA1/START domain
MLPGAGPGWASRRCRGNDAGMTEVIETVDVDAPAELVYDLVSDVTRMAEWRPENVGCRWLDPPPGPRVGARFRGTNRSGWRRWRTISTVTAAEPGRVFTWSVKYGPLPVSEWSYAVEPTATGCTVSETWRDRRAGWFRVGSVPTTGIRDREVHNRAGMRQTLAALKAAAEAAARP